MRLPKPFYRLPLRFDVDRLRAEVAELPADAWSPHPNGDAGNDAVRLISVDGGDNEEVNGVMRMTAHLERSPYLRQVLASFGVVWSRSRLLRLAPGANVPVHADIHHHWFYRVRLHIPVLTRPQVQFACGSERIHMAAGEVWLFDNWRLHQVDNPTDSERIHLVGDTSRVVPRSGNWRHRGRTRRAGPTGSLRSRRFRHAAHRASATAAGDAACGSRFADSGLALRVVAGDRFARSAPASGALPRPTAGISAAIGVSSMRCTGKSLRAGRNSSGFATTCVSNHACSQPV